GDPPRDRRGRLPLRVGRAVEPVRPPDGHRRPHAERPDRALPLRHRIRAEGPSPLARRGLAGQARLGRRSAPSALLPLRSADRKIRPARARRHAHGGNAHAPRARRVRHRHDPARPQDEEARGRQVMQPGQGYLRDAPLFPPRASEMARDIDLLFFTTLGVTIFFSTLIATLIAYFMIRYRRTSPSQVGREPRGNTMVLEVAWIVV